MHTPTLTIFTNFRINDEERFLRLKDSFHSFKDINAVKWVINIRGKYKDGVSTFLSEHLGDKLSLHYVESGKGWFHDSRLLLEEIDSDFVLYWIEDHINMVPVQIYQNVLSEMKASKSDFLFSSWWIMDQAENAYEGIPKEEYDHIKTMEIDLAASKKITAKVGLHFIISALGIFDSKLFKKVVSTNHPRLRRWPKDTPFDLEKRVTDTFWLPLRVSLPKIELFAPIDDDLRGYPGSLQTRGLYPLRELRANPVAKQSRSKQIVIDRIPQKLKIVIDQIFGGPYYKMKELIRRVRYHL